MGIHYDYKSTRGDKAMKKEAKRKARIEQRRAKRATVKPKKSEEKIMHDIGRNFWILSKMVRERNKQACQHECNFDREQPQI